jgi:hypothetical protein
MSSSRLLEVRTSRHLALDRTHGDSYVKRTRAGPRWQGEFIRGAGGAKWLRPRDGPRVTAETAGSTRTLQCRRGRRAHARPSGRCSGPRSDCEDLVSQAPWSWWAGDHPQRGVTPGLTGLTCERVCLLVPVRPEWWPQGELRPRGAARDVSRHSPARSPDRRSSRKSATRPTPGGGRTDGPGCAASAVPR